MTSGAQDRNRGGVSSTDGSDIERVVVILIKPTHYDDDGFPQRYARGVLPSNSLAVMRSLTERALADILPRGIATEIYMLEDGIERHARRLHRLRKRFPEKGTKLIVGLVGVQTAQFPRACDLIDRWQRRGATCVIGGFHVSGSISTLLDGIDDAGRHDVPCPRAMPAEIQALMDRGVTVFHGEAEREWHEVLRDLVAGRAVPLCRGGLPSLAAAPLPVYTEDYFERSFATRLGTFDTGRGCPFACTFCTIINVQGRQQRFRDPAAILRQLEAICERDGKASFFLTDDNFARNPRWEELLDGFIRIREKGHDISFMVEADLACHKIEGFLPKLAAAGCSQIFMGVESMNPSNLADSRKRQNKVEQYEEVWKACHDQGIAVHAGYIIGFPHDTPASVERDVESLFKRGVDQASFFILTPLPGCEDHVRAVAAGVAIDPDLNKCDSFHPIVDHPRMSREEWLAAYAKAWRQFYRVENMIAALKRCKTRRARLDLLRNYVWYRWSFATEGTHPMIAGFYRLRPYWDRRPSAPRLSYPGYLLREAGRHVRYLRRAIAEFYRFEQVVFETELAPRIQEKRGEIQDQLLGFREWLRFTFGKAAARRRLNAFWIGYARNRWRLLFHPLAIRWHVRVPFVALTEIVYTIRFAAMLPRLVKITTTGAP